DHRQAMRPRQVVQAHQRDRRQREQRVSDTPVLYPEKGDVSSRAQTVTDARLRMVNIRQQGRERTQPGNTDKLSMVCARVQGNQHSRRYADDGMGCAHHRFSLVRSASIATQVKKAMPPKIRKLRATVHMRTTLTASLILFFRACL